jgi:hypothetical protein
MNPVVGWGLAALAVALAWTQYGWRGVLLAASVIVFWLLLQFSRALRAMRAAGQRPVGSVDSAIMLNAQLRRGMPLMKVIPLAGSLGARLGDGEDPERWRWTDGGGASVTLELRRGRLEAWRLERPDQAAAEAGSTPAADAETAGAAGAAAGSAPATDAGASSR